MSNLVGQINATQNLVGAVNTIKIDVALQSAGINGKGLEFVWDGTRLGVRREGETEYIYTDLKPDGADVSSTVANKVIAQLGNGSLTSIPVTHNLNTRDCVVTIRENVSPYAMVITDMEFTDLNTITFKFAVAPTTNQYTATIIG